MEEEWLRTDFVTYVNTDDGEALRFFNDVPRDSLEDETNPLRGWCPFCGKFKGPSEIVWHHIIYEIELTIQICRSCHAKLHFHDEFDDVMRPPENAADDFYNNYAVNNDVLSSNGVSHDSEDDDEFEMNYELLAWLKASSRRREIVEILAEQPMNTSELKELWDVKSTNVPRDHLHEMEDKGIVRDLTPDRTRNNLYGLTELGEKINEYIGEIDD